MVGSSSKFSLLQAVHPAPPDVYRSPPSVSQAPDSAGEDASNTRSNLQPEGGCSIKNNQDCVDYRKHHHVHEPTAAERSAKNEENGASAQQTHLSLQGREVEEATNGLSLLSLQPGTRPHHLGSVENSDQEAKRERISSLRVPRDSQDVVTVPPFSPSSPLPFSIPTLVHEHHMWRSIDKTLDDS